MLTYLLRQAKLQHDVTRWAVSHVEATIEGGMNVIQDTLKFVDFLRRITRELKPADHKVLEFLQQLNINYYDIVSRKIDAEVFPSLLYPNCYFSYNRCVRTTFICLVSREI